MAQEDSGSFSPVHTIPGVYFCLISATSDLNLCEVWV